MANTSVTSANLAAFKTATDATPTSATIDTADGSETFEFAATGKPFILLATVGAINGAVALSMNSGDSWAAKPVSIGSAQQAKTTAFYVESGYGFKSTGKIEIKATPASGKKLVTDHALKLSIIQL